MRKIRIFFEILVLFLISIDCCVDVLFVVDTKTAEVSKHRAIQVAKQLPEDQKIRKWIAISRQDRYVPRVVRNNNELMSVLSSVNGEYEKFLEVATAEVARRTPTFQPLIILLFSETGVNETLSSTWKSISNAPSLHIFRIGTSKKREIEESSDFNKLVACGHPNNNKTLFESSKFSNEIRRAPIASTTSRPLTSTRDPFVRKLTFLNPTKTLLHDKSFTINRNFRRSTFAPTWRRYRLISTTTRAPPIGYSQIWSPQNNNNNNNAPFWSSTSQRNRPFGNRPGGGTHINTIPQSSGGNRFPIGRVTTSRPVFNAEQSGYRPRKQPISTSPARPNVFRTTSTGFTTPPRSFPTSHNPGRPSINPGNRGTGATASRTSTSSFNNNRIYPGRPNSRPTGSNNIRTPSSSHQGNAGRPPINPGRHQSTSTPSRSSTSQNKPNQGRPSGSNQIATTPARTIPKQSTFPSRPTGSVSRPQPSFNKLKPGNRGSGTSSGMPGRKSTSPVIHRTVSNQGRPSQIPSRTSTPTHNSINTRPSSRPNTTGSNIHSHQTGSKSQQLPSRPISQSNQSRPSISSLTNQPSQTSTKWKSVPRQNNNMNHRIGLVAPPSNTHTSAQKISNQGKTSGSGSPPAHNPLNHRTGQVSRPSYTQKPNQGHKSSIGSTSKPTLNSHRIGSTILPTRKFVTSSKPPFRTSTSRPIHLSTTTTKKFSHSTNPVRNSTPATSIKKLLTPISSHPNSPKPKITSTSRPIKIISKYISSTTSSPTIPTALSAPPKEQLVSAKNVRVRSRSVQFTLTEKPPVVAYRASILRTHRTTVAPPTTTPFIPPACLIDVYFMIDLSKGTGDKTDKYLQLITSTINQMPISKYAIHAGLIGYSGPGRTRTDVYLDQIFEKKKLIETMKKMWRNGGTTKTANAIRYAVKEFGSKAHPTRKGARKILVIFTDGYSQDNPKEAAKLARNQNIQIIAVAFDDKLAPPDVDQLKVIAESNILLSPKTSELRDKIVGSQCRL